MATVAAEMALKSPVVQNLASSVASSAVSTGRGILSGVLSKAQSMLKFSDRTDKIMYNKMKFAFGDKEKADKLLSTIENNNLINDHLREGFVREFDKSKNSASEFFTNNLKTNRQKSFLGCKFININKLTTIYYIRKYFYDVPDVIKFFRLSNDEFNAFYTTMNNYSDTDLFTVIATGRSASTYLVAVIDNNSGKIIFEKEFEEVDYNIVYETNSNRCNIE